jgi:hypothetical protein
MLAQKELVFQTTSDYELDEDQAEAVQAVLDAWTTRITILTDKYAERATAMAKGRGVVEAEAGPVTYPFFLPPYPWWNVLLAGPYQPFVGVGPQKNFQAGQFAFVVGALWLNPAPINWFPPGPNPATVMGGWNMKINFETMNLSTVAAGPAIHPIEMNPIGASFGPPFFKPFFRLLGPGVFPVPAQGTPHLYEMNVTADISGPAPQPFFAGYSTWVYDPDMEPPVWPPQLPIPGLNLPPVFPHWQYDIPMRFLVYTA